MAIKVLIERRLQSIPGNERKALAIMKEVRVHCLDQPGYITGETLRDNDDPSTLIVVSTWFGLGDWRRWYTSDVRRQFELQLQPLLTGNERVRVLLEGISDTHSGA